METHFYDWMHLVGRWAHIIAGIMWVGDSFLFMWMDRQLRPVPGAPAGSMGEMWMVHAGGFYQVEKTRFLDPARRPKELHWFKWESYSTWLTGMFLLVVVYYTGSGAFLVDPTASPLSPPQAIAVGLGVLVLGWVLYDQTWKLLGERAPVLASALLVAALLGITYGLTKVLTGRAAFMHVGALIGTVMAGNVFFRIMPVQRALLAALDKGEPPDPTRGLGPKKRSTHNHYLTLPLLFTMLSNHFPATYGHPHAWLVLGLLMAFGVAAKEIMIRRAATPAWITGVAVLSITAVLVMTAPIDWAKAGKGTEAAAGPPVSFAAVNTVVQQRCASCHADKPTSPMFVAPPLGVVLTAPEQLRHWAERMKVRVVDTRTMPLGNLTGMTDEERALLGAWVAQGAKVP